jgi:hypothetical protein
MEAKKLAVFCVPAVLLFASAPGADAIALPGGATVTPITAIERGKMTGFCHVFRSIIENFLKHEPIAMLLRLTNVDCNPQKIINENLFEGGTERFSRLYDKR